MKNVYLSKSKYCKAVQCNNILWLDKNKPEESINKSRETVLETGTKVGELAKSYFGKYTDIHSIYLDDISYQVYILQNLGYKIKKANIMYINNKYIREEELELDKLFKIEDVTDTVFLKQEEIKKLKNIMKA